MSPMDVVAVLAKVVQEQQRLAEDQQKTIAELQKQIDELIHSPQCCHFGIDIKQVTGTKRSM